MYLAQIIQRRQINLARHNDFLSFAFKFANTQSLEAKEAALASNVAKYLSPSSCSPLYVGSERWTPSNPVEEFLY